MNDRSRPGESGSEKTIAAVNTMITPTAPIPSTPPRGPKAHKALARQLGIPHNSAGELIVLDYGNDPFYMGTPTEKRHAEWFAGLIERFGLQLGGHIRRVHYRIITAPEPIDRPDGRAYENNLTCWGMLGDASRAARIFGLIDVESMVDRRNSDAVENAVARSQLLQAPDWTIGAAGLYLPTLEFADIDSVTGRLSSPRARGYDYDPGDQPVMIELWVEKSTMADILEPLCRHERLNYVEGTGYESITRTVEFLRRAERYGKAAHIIYVSDFDPAGAAMPVAVARQIQFWLDELNIDVDVSVDTSILTHDQCVEYELPRTPIKATDVRRGNFEARYGEGATELDALEAIYPGELAKIIRQRIAPYRDRGLSGRLSRTRSEVHSLLEDAWNADGGPELQQQMEELVEQANTIAAEQAERIRQIMDETREQLQGFVDAADDLDRQAREIKRNIDVELPERPQPEITGPDPDVLFDSRRHWLDQLTVFKARQNGNSNGGGS
jgi:hypothetical protein